MYELLIYKLFAWNLESMFFSKNFTRHYLSKNFLTLSTFYDLDHNNALYNY